MFGSRDCSMRRIAVHSGALILCNPIQHLRFLGETLAPARRFDIVLRWRAEQQYQRPRNKSWWLVVKETLPSYPPASGTIESSHRKFAGRRGAQAATGGTARCGVGADSPPY